MKTRLNKRPDIRERRIFFYTCAACGKKRRQTFRRRKARDKLCRKCRRGAVHENQLILLPATPTETEIK